jgi:hypothetical protein
MADAYAGDSEAKRLIRAWFWSEASLPTVTEPAIVLASRDGGDLECLKRLGASQGSVIAVDRNAQALKKCEGKHGSFANFVHGDVGLVLGHIAPSSVYLDFCGCFGEETFSATRKAFEKCGHVGVVLQMGREAGEPFKFATLDELRRWIIVDLERTATLTRREMRMVKASLRNNSKLAQKATELERGNNPVTGWDALGGWCFPKRFNRYVAPQDLGARESESGLRSLDARVETLLTCLQYSTAKPTQATQRAAYRGHRVPMMHLTIQPGDDPVAHQMPVLYSDEACRFWKAAWALKSQRFRVAAGISDSSVPALRAHMSRGTYWPGIEAQMKKAPKSMRQRELSK